MKKFLFVVDISDPRGLYIREYLKEDNFEVLSFEDSFDTVDKTAVYIYSLFKVVDTEDVKKLADCSIIFARLHTEAAMKVMSEKQMKFFSIYDDEAFVVKNAYLTAEGALAYIILNTLCTIKKMPILVLGYGRLGKSLTKILKDNQAVVTVATDDTEEYALASIFADRVYTLSEYYHSLGEYEAIINTIPVKILKGEKLKLLHPECFVLDLASKPGGIDYNDAINYGVKHMHALGVPGKVAPKTAGLYIKECVVKRLKTL